MHNIDMAQEARDERKLMRQRGAGLRDVADPEFDLDLGAGSREERRLMRQRGAGNREVNNIDFGFAFATPVQVPRRASRIRSKTPAVSTRTPLRRNVENIPIPPSSARSTESQRLPDTTTQRSVNASASQSQRKRRRLSEISNITRATSLDIPIVSETNDPEVFNNDLQEDSRRILQPVSEQHFRNTYYTVPSSPLFVPRLDHHTFEADKENLSPESEAVKVTAKKKKRKSIGQQSLFKKKRSSGSSVVPLPTPPIIDEDLPLSDTEEDPPDSLSTNDDSVSLNVAPKELTPASLTSVRSPNTTSIIADPPRQRKKRKPIAAVRKKRRSTNNVSVIPRNIIPAAHIERDEEPVEEPTSEHDSVTESNHDLSVARRTLRRRLSTSPREDAPEAVIPDEDADETYLPDVNTPEPTPAPKRARETRKNKQSSNGTARTATASRKNDSFPILTHRMTNTHNLPTIFEEAEEDVTRDVDGDDDAIDELSLPPPAIVTRSTPNAIDVLAQACRETVDSHIQKFKEGSNQVSRADRARQLTALQTFGSNLDVQLFDLSQSFDQRLHMEARLRKQRREKAELQARWLDVRKQRDRLELQKDAIRRQHWEAEASNRKAWNVSQLAHRLETAVSRDEDDMNKVSAADHLEFSLDQLKRDVSLKDGGGILNVLRQFNAQLEQTAKALN